MDQLSDKRLYQIALTQITGIGDKIARNILSVIGDEELIFKSSKKSLLTIPGISEKLVGEIHNSAVLKKAEKELLFIEKYKIHTYFITDREYPKRLLDCPDAPILLYYKGNAGLNSKYILSIVGTRKATPYGNAFCESFLKDLSEILPDIIIVSGLAYGIDIQAHKNALNNNLSTVGVLAHGLDRIYPHAHRQIAEEMCNKNGGLLTEFVSGTEPDKFNFVKRNRIVAGISDAVIVVESDAKGGSLITAEIANSYCKDVFAVPGRLTDKSSCGCNNLIANHKADLFVSAQHFLQQMGWSREFTDSNKIPKQQKLFIELTSEEQMIVDRLTGKESLHLDILAQELEMSTYQLFPVLLELEMKNIIKNMPGNLFSLV